MEGIGNQKLYADGKKLTKCLVPENQKMHLFYNISTMS